MPTPATKGISDDLKAIFRKIVEGMPRDATPEESAAYHGRVAPIDDSAALEKRQAEMKVKLDALDADFIDHVDPLVERLVKGDITPSVFRGLMLVEIRFNRLTAAMIAAGGISQMTSDDRARVDAQVKEEYGYLSRWAEQLTKTPNTMPSAAELKRRAHLYANGGHALAQETFDKNVMGKFPNLPFYPGTRQGAGGTLCGKGCACGWIWTEIDLKKGNAKVYWRLEVRHAVKEDCETCLRRAARFIPLICENWQWVNMPTDLDPYVYP